MQSPFTNLPPVVKNLLIINILCFLPSVYLSHNFSIPGFDPMGNWFGIYYFNSANFRIWQVITYMFIHGGWLHIIFNMFVLFQFGPIVEYSLGSKRFFNMYFICGLGAIALQMLVQGIEVHAITGAFTIPNPTTDPNYFYQFGVHAQKMYDIYTGGMIGASGAIFGIMIAFAMLYPNMELMIMFIPVPVKAKYAIMGYVALELYLTLNQTQGDNVAHLAHLGGALFGFLLIKFWGIKKPNSFY
jgi:membrane associated rhomboid family serine protease